MLSLFENVLFSRSLFDSRAPSVDRLVEEDPTFLRKFRQKSRCDLEDQLEKVGLVDPGARTKISEEEFKMAIGKLKEQRRGIKNVKI